MLSLYGIYKSNWVKMGDIAKDDSVASMWLKRAVAEGNPIAKRMYAQWEDVHWEEAEKLYAEAVKGGDKQAYLPWSGLYLEKDVDDPQKYFEIINLAIVDTTEGVHRWVTNIVDGLNRGIRKGNEESVRYMAIVDRLDLVGQLEQIPDLPVPPFAFIGKLCEEQVGWGTWRAVTD